ncbi:MAG: nucleotidyltransferase domain-containing protein [Tannerella sp.]|nr:nucleotidyltransferase domain-containing protein [Tannerella sp.]
MEADEILDELIGCLKASDPYKIILFGSYADGKASEDSDMDIMVVLDNNNIAKTYGERMAKKLYIRKLVRNINYKMALDILVYSKAELKMMKDYGNFFIDEIEKTGKIIYEKVG